MNPIYNQHAAIPPFREKFYPLCKNQMYPKNTELFDVRDLRKPKIIHPSEGLMNYAYYDLETTPHFDKILNKHQNLTFIFFINSARRMIVGLEKPFQLIDSKFHKEHIEYILRNHYKEIFIDMVYDFLQIPATIDELEQCLFAIAADKAIDNAIYHEIMKNDDFIKKFGKILQRGHPTLSHIMDERGQIIKTESLGFIGGELKFDINRKQWTLNNKSGRYGMAQNTQEPVEQMRMNLKYLHAAHDMMRKANISAQVKLYDYESSKKEIKKINPLPAQRCMQPSGAYTHACAPKRATHAGVLPHRPDSRDRSLTHQHCEKPCRGSSRQKHSHGSPR